MSPSRNPNTFSIFAAPSALPARDRLCWLEEVCFLIVVALAMGVGLMG